MPAWAPRPGSTPRWRGSDGTLARDDRWAALDASGATVWLTGAAGSLAPVAEAVERRLVEDGAAAYLLDRRLSGEGLVPRPDGAPVRRQRRGGDRRPARRGRPGAAAGEGAARGRGAPVPRRRRGRRRVRRGRGRARARGATRDGVRAGLMRKLLLIALIGFGAQLVDGALGMAYGATSTSLLLSAGLAPAVVSATVHLAEIGTTAASGAAHWRFRTSTGGWSRSSPGPASIGALPRRRGAQLAVRRRRRAGDGRRAGRARAVRAAALLGARRPAGAARPCRPLPAIFLAPLGLFAGFMDAAGGGGWGPIGDAGAALDRARRAAPRGRLDRHQRVRGRARRLGRLPRLARQRADRLRVGGRAARGRAGGGPDRGLPRAHTPAAGCSARASAG